MSVWNTDASANKLNKSYIKEFLDISGGDLILRHNDLSCNLDLRVSGSGSFVSLPSVTSNITPTDDKHLVTKKYVDDNTSSGSGSGSGSANVGSGSQSVAIQGNVLITGNTEFKSHTHIGDIGHYGRSIITEFRYQELGTLNKGSLTIQWYGHNLAMDYSGNVIVSSAEQKGIARDEWHGTKFNRTYHLMTYQIGGANNQNCYVSSYDLKYLHTQGGLQNPSSNGGNRYVWRWTGTAYEAVIASFNVTPQIDDSPWSDHQFYACSGNGMVVILGAPSSVAPDYISNPGRTKIYRIRNPDDGFTSNDPSSDSTIYFDLKVTKTGQSNTTNPAVPFNITGGGSSGSYGVAQQGWAGLSAANIDGSVVVTGQAGWLESDGSYRDTMVYTFIWNTSTSSYTEKSQTLMAAASGHVGYMDDMQLTDDANTLTITFPFENTDGLVRVYNWDSSSEKWIQQGSDIPSLPSTTGQAANEQIESTGGNQVAINKYGNVLFFFNSGADYNVAEAGAGRIWFFNESCNDWTPFDNRIENNAFTRYGAVAMSRLGERFVWTQTEQNSRAGIAKMYDLTAPNPGVDVFKSLYSHGIAVPTITTTNLSVSSLEVMYDYGPKSNYNPFVKYSLGNSNNTAASVLHYLAGPTDTLDENTYVINVTGFPAYCIRLDSTYKCYMNSTLTSDDRLKTNEQYIENATETLLKLRPQVYDKQSKYDATLRKESGLIAQEVYYNAPELRHIVYHSNLSKLVDVSLNIQDPAWDPDNTKSRVITSSHIRIIQAEIKARQDYHDTLRAWDKDKEQENSNWENALAEHNKNYPEAYISNDDTVAPTPHLHPEYPQQGDYFKNTTAMPIWTPSQPQVDNTDDHDDPSIDPDYNSIGWNNEYATLSYSQLLPYIIKTNQELHTRNITLKSQIDSITSEFNSIDTRISVLEAR